MGAVQESSLVDFQALADDPSAERRAELLDNVSSLFAMVADNCANALLTMYDSVLIRLADMSRSIDRTRLAERMADLRRAPAGIVRRLAMDDIVIAEPLLLRSAALSEYDLVGIAQLCGNRHRRAIARRPEIGPPVTLVLVTRGDDGVRRLVAGNPTAGFSDEGLDRLVVQAVGDPELQVLLARHPASNQRVIAALGHFAVPEAMAAVRARASSLDVAGLLAAHDYAAAADRVAERAGAGSLTIEAAGWYAVEDRFAEAAQALSRLADVPLPVVLGWFAAFDVTALVAVVRALGGGEADLLRLISAAPCRTRAMAEHRIAALREFRALTADRAGGRLAGLRLVAA